MVGVRAGVMTNCQPPELKTTDQKAGSNMFDDVSMAVFFSVRNPTMPPVDLRTRGEFLHLHSDPLPPKGLRPSLTHMAAPKHCILMRHLGAVLREQSCLDL